MLSFLLRHNFSKRSYEYPLPNPVTMLIPSPLNIPRSPTCCHEISGCNLSQLTLNTEGTSYAPTFSDRPLQHTHNLEALQSPFRRYKLNTKNARHSRQPTKL